MNLQNFYRQTDKSFEQLISNTVMKEQPDSRAFGAYVEKLIKDNWQNLCKEWGAIPQEHPGRRTIYDVNCIVENEKIGFDIKSKDLDTTRYADGGICAVGNLLKYMVRNNASLILSEFGYMIKNNSVVFDYVVSIPFHLLPEDTYRIENLGTGQLRLNYTLKKSYQDVSWNRTKTSFYEIFSKLCLKHYSKVSEVAEKRRKAIEWFIKSGYKEINIK